MTALSVAVFRLMVAVVASPSPAPLEDVDQIPCHSEYYEQFGSIVTYLAREKKFAEVRATAPRVLKFMNRCDGAVGDVFRARLFEAGVYFYLALALGYAKQLDESDGNVSKAIEIARDELRRTDLSDDDRAALSRAYASFIQFQREIEKKRQPR